MHSVQWTIHVFTEACSAPLLHVPWQHQQHCTALKYSPLKWTALYCTSLHYTALHGTTLHYTALNCTKLNYTAIHCTTLHYAALHCTTLHYTTVSCDLTCGILSYYDCHVTWPVGGCHIMTVMWPDLAPVFQSVLMIQWLKAQHLPLIYSRQVNFVMFSFKTEIWKKLKWPKHVKVIPDKFCN